MMKGVHIPSWSTLFQWLVYLSCLLSPQCRHRGCSYMINCNYNELRPRVHFSHGPSSFHPEISWQPIPLNFQDRLHLLLGQPNWPLISHDNFRQHENPNNVFMGLFVRIIRRIFHSAAFNWITRQKDITASLYRRPLCCLPFFYCI